MKTDIVSELSTRFPPEAIVTQPEEMLAYSYDRAPVLRQLPKAVLMVSSREEVATILALAAKHGTPVVTRGSGAGLNGRSVPVESSIVLCTARMNRILELDTDNLTMMVEPGVTNNEVALRADAVGLFYPPDSGPMKVSTLGVSVSENAGGLRGLKYGVTRDYVMGLEVVLATGEIFFTGNKCVKDVAGYSLKDIFLGSEEILGIVTKILLKLIPKPAARKTLLAIYERMDEAVATVSAITAAKIVPCTMEFLDRTTIRSIDNHPKVGLPFDCEAILLLESDGHPAAVDEEAARMERIARENGAQSVSLAKDIEEATLANDRNPDELRRARETGAEIFWSAVKLSGAISGQHGIGLTKEDFSPGTIGEIDVRVLREIKRVLDPEGILNPGKIFD
jgi:glycolate oxidase